MSDADTSHAATSHANMASFADRALAWFKRNERRVLLGAAGFHLAVLLTMVAFQATPLLTGETILVRVIPIDPRDMFRGDYVILSYEFSRIPTEGIEGLPLNLYYSDASYGQEIYVTLEPEPDGLHWRPTKYSIEPPESGKYIRGELTGPGPLSFGIDAFYVQEGTGLAYEEAIRNRTLSAELALTPDGRASLVDLHIE
ncbi:MAG: GDYXXLXY domain-containing protein [Candidatus Hydrogenedentales bacterium]